MDTISDFFSGVKNFFKKNWALMLTAVGLVCVAVVTAVAYPGFFPAVAARIVDVSARLWGAIAGFFVRNAPTTVDHTQSQNPDGSTTHTYTETVPA